MQSDGISRTLELILCRYFVSAMRFPHPGTIGRLRSRIKELTRSQESGVRILPRRVREKCMHHILLIFFLFLIFCGPLAVIRTALGCGTLIVLAAILIALVYLVVKLNQPDTNLPAAGPRADLYRYQQRWIDGQTAQRAEPVLFNQQAQDSLLESPPATRRAVLAMRLPKEHTSVRVMRAELVKLPSANH